MDIDSASSVVLQTLTQATSQDTALLKPAEEQLKQWETQPGFYSVLLVRPADHKHTRHGPKSLVLLWMADRCAKKKKLVYFHMRHDCNMINYCWEL